MTQRPDTSSLPKGLSANASVKICLRMTDHVAVDMVLGTGAHGRGLEAEPFKQSEQGVDRMWNRAAVGALEILRPDAWGGLNEASLGQLLAKRNVPTKPLNRKDPQDPPGSPRRNLTRFTHRGRRRGVDRLRGWWAGEQAQNRDDR